MRTRHLIVAAAALLAATFSAPAGGERPRSKFPGANPAALAELHKLNAYVNGVIQYQSDQEHYGLPEVFVSLPGDLKGDCEDYALSKLVLLEDSRNINHLYDARLRFAVVTTAAGEKFGHAVLEVRLAKGVSAILDNRTNELMTVRELERKHGYEFVDDW